MSIKAVNKEKWLEKFWNKKVINPNNCWIWQGGDKSQEYGMTYYSPEKRYDYVHRISYIESHKTNISDKKIIMHKCDTPKCFNPEHLILGTQKDNIQDSINKGRFLKNRKKRILSKSCRRGHDYNENNTYIYNKIRICRSCQLLAVKKYRKK